jgi:uncharacterized lipoprotein NlpE involved in copper resistance
MKKSVLFLSIVVLALAGCGNNPISLVKNGMLEDFDKSTTIGKAFDNYAYFLKTDWKVITMENGKVIVHFIGYINIDKALNSKSQIVFHSKKNGQTYEHINDIENMVRNELSEGDIKNIKLEMQFQIMADGKSFSPSYMGMEATCNGEDKDSQITLPQDITDIITCIYNNQYSYHFLFDGCNPVHLRW